MNPTQRPRYLSPSDYHRHLMEKTKPLMGFEKSIQDPKNWQKRLRKKVKELIGIIPSTKCDLRVRSLWKKNHPLGSIEKISYTSEPYSDVTAYVCLPKNVKPPFLFTICLQGHSTGAHKSIGVQREDESKTEAVEGDRDFGLYCMSRGIAALCIEQRCFGERREQKQKCASSHECHDAAMHSLMLGKTLLGERLYDVDRGIDYLASRGDVQMKKIGVTGDSGGGMISLFAAALLPRISFAMPACYFCTFKESIMSIYHCTDNYIPGLYRYAEMADIAGLITPKPVVMVAGKDDDLFPLQGTKRAFKDLQKIYQQFGAEENCRLVIGNEGHRFYAREGWDVLLPLIQK
ncbi:MAG: alpha/beta hydrolase family protein [Verrucomicrobiota bacterium]